MRPPTHSLAVSFSLAFLAFAPAFPKSQGLIAHWDFDEGQGNIFRDRSGNGHNGTVQGNAAWTDGIKGKALSLDGVTRGNVPFHSAFNLPEYTVMAWVKTTYSSLWQGLVARQHETGSPIKYRLILTGDDPDGWNSPARRAQIGFWSKSEPESTFVNGNTSMTDGKWHMVVGTYKNRELRIYLDGKLDGKRATVMDPLLNDSTPVMIGATGYRGGSYFLHGALDDARIYDYAWDEKEVAGHYTGLPGHVLLDMEFNHPDSIGKQAAPGLPTAALLHDVGPAATTPGAADFGTAGRMQIASFPHPNTPFTVEARFKMRSYGAQGSHYLADLVNTATWEGGPIQGLVFRVGGGLLYPPLPRQAYASEDQYQRSLTQVGNGDRASISRCLGELAIAAKPGGTAQWLEAFTDRCIEPDQWAHLVAVWDGKAMRIYLDGREATDRWRINGAGSLPALDPTALLTVGAKGDKDGDDRHFNGIMDFVRMVDTALTEKQIRQRYRETFTPEQLNHLCRGFIFPNSPAPGELTGGGSIFLFNLQFHAACSDSLGKLELRPGDSVDVEFARDPLFQEILLRFTVGSTRFRLDDLKLAAQLTSREIYWRARLRRAGGLAKSGADAQEGEWSSQGPFFWETTPSRVSAHPGSGHFRRVLWQSESGLWLPDDASGKAPVLFLPSGRRANVRFRREAGGWRADPSTHMPSGVLLLLSPGPSGQRPR